MVKVLLSVLILFVSVNCNASIFGSLFTKSDSKTTNTTANNIAEQTKKIGVIESLIKEFKAEVGIKLGSVDAKVQGQAGYGNKIEEVRKDMRDEIQNIKTELNLTMTKISNKQTEINKAITKTSIKQNQASIFYVLSIILGVVCMCLMAFSFLIVSKFARASTRDLDKQCLVDKYEKELDSLREKKIIN